MKRITTVLLFLLLLTSSLFALTDKELAISIDLSGKQRMLTQKMTKESFLIRSNIDKDINMEKLRGSSQLFDKTLKGLMSGDSSLKLVPIQNEDIQKQLQKVEKLWKPFYKNIQAILSGSKDKENYLFLEENNIKLLKEMNRAVEMYASQNKEDNKFKLGNDINLAGKQRMLTQKMGKDLLFAKNKFKRKHYIADFKRSRQLFSKTLDGLFHGSEELKLQGTKLSAITNQLEIVKKLWNQHQDILNSAVRGKDLKRAIAGLDNILVEMNKAVIQYTKSINRHKQRLKFASIVDSFMNEHNTLKRLINLSGKQRMLTQRVTKLALLISSNIDKKENIERLKKFSALYDRTLKAFENGDEGLNCTPIKNPAIEKQIKIIEGKWDNFYKHIKRVINNKDSNGKSLKYIIANNEELLKASNELVKLYEESDTSENYLDKARLHIVNVAGRQRMLTQKMTKEKLLISQGNREYSQKLKGTIKLFDDSLNALIHGDTQQMIVEPSNHKIEEQLKQVAKIWSELKPLYEKDKLSKDELERIIDENPILLSEMDKMVKMSEVEIEY